MANLLFTTTLADVGVNNLEPGNAASGDGTDNPYGFYNESNYNILFRYPDPELPSSQYYRILDDDSAFYNNSPLSNLFANSDLGTYSQYGLKDYYFIIGSEKIIVYQQLYDPPNDRVIIRVTRGADGTTAVAHSPGEIVQFWEDDRSGDEEEEQTTGGQAQEQVQHSRKILFKNKPYTGIDSHHTYLPGNNNTNNLKESDSSPLRYDKFTKNNLHTNTIGQEVNEAVIDSHIQYNLNNNNGDPLRYLAESYIRIDDFVIKHYGSRTVRSGNLLGFMFDRNTYNIFDDSGIVKSATDLFSELIDNTFWKYSYR